MQEDGGVDIVIVEEEAAKVCSNSIFGSSCSSSKSTSGRSNFSEQSMWPLK